MSLEVKSEQRNVIAGKVFSTSSYRRTNSCPTKWCEKTLRRSVAIQRIFLVLDILQCRLLIRSNLERPISTCDKFYLVFKYHFPVCFLPLATHRLQPFLLLCSIMNLTSCKKINSLSFW